LVTWWPLTEEINKVYSNPRSFDIAVDALGGVWFTTIAGRTALANL
jgi:hypothetical protein